MAIERLLSVEAGSARYDGPEVLQDVTVEVRERSAVALLGANGAGKSTLLRVIMGQINPTRGRVVLRGQDLAGLATHSRIRLGIGYVPEGRALFPNMTVVENLEAGARHVTARERKQRLENVVTVFPPLTRLSKTRCGLLSGGEQQMVAVGRALMSNPTLLVLDEPSTGLAPRVIGELYAALSALREDGLAVLIAEQNVHAVLGFADYGYVFEDGRSTMSGPAGELLADSRLVDAYVGRSMRDGVDSER